MNDSTNNNIQNVLNKIRGGELQLKPRSYFTLKFILLIVVVLAILVVSVFFASFILFSLRASGQAALIGFGPSGWQVFFMLFPWKLLILEVVLTVVLEWMLRSFKFGYKVPALYLLAGVLVATVLLGIVVQATPLHDALLGLADHNHLPPPLGSFYEQVHQPPPRGDGFFRGTILSLGTSTLEVALDNPAGVGTTTEVEVDLPQGQTPGAAQVGDRIFIEGQMVGGKIEARGIRSANDMPPPDNDHEPNNNPPQQE